MNQAHPSAATIAEAQIVSLQALNTPLALISTLRPSRVAEAVGAEARQQEVVEQQEQIMQNWTAGLTRAEQAAILAESMILLKPPRARLHGGCSVLTDRCEYYHLCTQCVSPCNGRWQHAALFPQDMPPCYMSACCQDLEYCKQLTDNSMPWAFNSCSGCKKLSALEFGPAEAASSFRDTQQLRMILCFAVVGSRGASLAIH